MSTATEVTTDELIEKLYSIEGKAEIVDRRIVRMSPSPAGNFPGSAAGAIYASLRLHAKRVGGRAYADNVVFLINLPRRKSFCPDAAYFTRPRSGMKFLNGAPVFAVQVRSETDYAPGAEKQISDKRAEYFAAGTKVMWDIDLVSDEPIRAYRAAAPETPQVFRSGESANAEPAVPGWTFPVDEFYD